LFKALYSADVTLFQLTKKGYKREGGI